MEKSGNGKVASPPVSYYDRFMGVLQNPLNRRESPPSAPEQPEPSADEKRTLQLADWATRTDCVSHFMPYLDELIRDADDAITANLAVHPFIAYATGTRDALVALRGQFHKWAGTTP